ncbi:CD1375 family protein [Exiguobacterium sp. CinTr1]|nr:CD1375 family protein [Exiguobacterium sp. CinTr1]
MNELDLRMVDVYVALIVANRRQLSDVPAHLQDAVQAKIETPVDGV